ncbi:2'-5' RNA ligase family protein [Flavobacterium daemonense]|uniref:2'-5' RNA ligase family protein n=1 Tax=Flavobacterium daemonense TaxID=1393049 RepID=UPI0011862699|nr:2'-5' RNA ligase family protein [Flavobacterium daemonense]KAF2329840.1 2'-5' RNA ligase family protein [Flavobacterium daemonense]
MEKTYSVVIHPSDNVIDAIKLMKDYLKSKIGWFNSCNSVAHITICEFKIEESQLPFIKKKLSKTADAFTPFQVYLNHFNSYPNSGAFFIGTTEDSENNLVPIMRKIHETLKSQNLKKSDNPHLSIGRRLTPENTKIASELFTTIDLQFLCDKIVLREFDPVKKQFFVIDAFSFGSNPEPEFVQGSLF